MGRSRLTRQKESLNQELKNMDSFFTADDLYSKVKNKGIGIATIYRFLSQIIKEGTLHSYSCNRKTVYSIDKKNHCHFICERCNLIKHIDLKRLEFLNKELKGKICHFQINITGICEKCQSYK